MGVALAAPAQAQDPFKPQEAPPPPEKIQLLDDAEAPVEGEDDPERDPAATQGAPHGAPRTPRRGRREEHDGLMLRAQLGPGYGAATLRSSPALKVTGAGAMLSLDLGYAVTEALTVHGRYAMATILTGEAKLGSEVQLGESEPTVTVVMFGVAGTYYLMPSNLFATLTVGLGATTMQVDLLRDTDTDMGWAFSLDLGKEWWVADNAGIGVALRGWFSAMAAESRANVYFPAVALLLSATYQ